MDEPKECRQRSCLDGFVVSLKAPHRCSQKVGFDDCISPLIDLAMVNSLSKAWT